MNDERALAFSLENYLPFKRTLERVKKKTHTLSLLFHTLVHEFSESQCHLPYGICTVRFPCPAVVFDLGLPGLGASPCLSRSASKCEGRQLQELQWLSPGWSCPTVWAPSGNKTLRSRDKHFLSVKVVFPFIFSVISTKMSSTDFQILEGKKWWGEGNVEK